MQFNAIRATAVCVLAVGGLITAPVADADYNDIEINGIYTAHSDGQTARTNDQFHDEVPVTATWKVESTCQNFLECSGKVTSDQGWVGDLTYRDNRWRAVHQIDGWE